MTPVHSKPGNAAASLCLDGVACGAGHRTLFEGLSLKLEAGQWATLRGHNGSGKSTLLRCLAGLSTPMKGEIARQGTVLYQSHLAGWKDLLTPLENLHWQCQLEGGDTASKDAVAIRVALAATGLQAQEDLSFAVLSAGQKRRVSMARLMLSEASIWLLDEPGTALDKQGQQLFGEVLESHLKSGGLALIATHLDIPGLAPDFSVDLGET